MDPHIFRDQVARLTPSVKYHHETGRLIFTGCLAAVDAATWVYSVQDELVRYFSEKEGLAAIIIEIDVFTTSAIEPLKDCLCEVAKQETAKPGRKGAQNVVALINDDGGDFKVREFAEYLERQCSVIQVEVIDLGNP